MCELSCSGGLSDAIVMRLARKNGNVRVPEMRLWLVFPAVVLTAGMCSLGVADGRLADAELIVQLV